MLDNAYMEYPKGSQTAFYKKIIKQQKVSPTYATIQSQFARNKRIRLQPNLPKKKEKTQKFFSAC